jgi:hypothetical protein
MVINLLDTQSWTSSTAVGSWEPTPLAALRSIGACETVVGAGSRERWIEFEAELDRFSAYGLGQASQKRFLFAPHAALGGRTPVEALGQEDGFETALHALRQSLAHLEAHV